MIEEFFEREDALKERTCTIYRSSRKRELYVYMDEQAAPEELPEALRRDLGKLSQVMTLLITPERRLARVNARQVLEAIGSKGYFLQLPPNMEAGIFTHGE